MTVIGATRDITLDTELPYPPEKVWRTLTTAELIGSWLMPTDFEPVLGGKFTFRTKPLGG